MSGNNDPENWRNVTGIGHGQNWGVPTAYSKNGTAWGKAMNPSAVNNDKASPTTPAKGLNATAPSFTPSGGNAKKYVDRGREDDVYATDT
ncbi:hypothetical protein J4E91_003175 [Alternaria rosae]|nr:hypothetical protein J4E91_003175 [Alternaria rosae]